MEAVPRDIRTGEEPQLTGVSCPDCLGVLSVRSEGRMPLLIFECRIGHTYAVEELLAAKEERLEERLWTVVTALEELTTLLDDLDAREGTQRFAARTARSREQLARMRDIIAHSPPVELDAPPGSPVA